MKDIKTIDSLYHACTYGRAPVVFERGRGARLWDDKGRDYIDFGSGIGVMSLGYANPEWVKAVSEQAAVLPHTSNLFYNEKTAMLAGRLALRTHFERVFLSNSGAEANECLIKTARKWASDTKGEGEHPFVTLVNSFHGRTLTTVTATGQDTFHKFFGPFTPGFRYVPASDLAALERQLDAEDCSAVLVEIVQGEGGVRALDADYLKTVEALCHEKERALLRRRSADGQRPNGHLVRLRAVPAFHPTSSPPPRASATAFPSAQRSWARRQPRF